MIIISKSPAHSSVKLGIHVIKKEYITSVVKMADTYLRFTNELITHLGFGNDNPDSFPALMNMNMSPIQLSMRITLTPRIMR